MMGRQGDDQSKLFYEFCLEDRVPSDHLLRKIDRLLDLAMRQSGPSARPCHGVSMREVQVRIEGGPSAHSALDALYQSHANPANAIVIACLKRPPRTGRVVGRTPTIQESR
jgi:hypothetical protein